MTLSLPRWFRIGACGLVAAAACAQHQPSGSAAHGQRSMYEDRALAISPIARVLAAHPALAPGCSRKVDMLDPAANPTLQLNASRTVSGTPCRDTDDLRYR